MGGGIITLLAAAVSVAKRRGGLVGSDCDDITEGVGLWLGICGEVVGIALGATTAACSRGTGAVAGAGLGLGVVASAAVCVESFLACFALRPSTLHRSRT